MLHSGERYHAPAFRHSRQVYGVIGPSSAAADRPAKARGFQPVYVTARGDQNTRKTPETFSALAETGLGLAIGIGNRASDIKAYKSASVAQIFIKQPEFALETKELIESGQAIGFESYVDIRATFEQQTQAAIAE